MLSDKDKVTIQKDLEIVKEYRDLMSMPGWLHFEKYLSSKLKEAAKKAGNTKATKDSRLVALGVLDEMTKIINFPNRVIDREVSLYNILSGVSQ